MSEDVREKIQIHNCHIHTFSYRCVPEKFLPGGIIRFVAKRSTFFARLLNSLVPERDDDLYDRYADLIRIMRCSQQDIFDYIRRFYPPDTRFVVLTMDMAFMEAGKVPKPFTKQLDELLQLKQRYPKQILPFIAVDPRREGITALVKEYVEKGCCGLKLYPPLGYFPYDERLNAIYEFAQEKQLPIVSHCGVNNPVHTRMNRKELKKKIEDELDPSLGITPTFIGKKNRQLTDYLSHPANYKVVFKKFPNLKISLAHFGGQNEWKEFLNPTTYELGASKKQKEKAQKSREDNWFTIIYDMLKEYPNLYSDISYTLSYPQYFPVLKVILQNPEIRQQILFGTDYHVVRLVISERAFSINLRGYLGEQDFRQIAEINPRVFLGKFG